jgi:hypothetical protein
VLPGIQHKLPNVVAGIHEGHNEIDARVGLFSNCGEGAVTLPDNLLIDKWEELKQVKGG